MFLKPTEVQSMARALARHSAGRQALVAQNMANADTPGYRVRDLARFSEVYRTENSAGLRATRSGHLGGGPAVVAPVILAKGSASPSGNAVSIEQEMVKSVDLRQQHDLALAVQKSLGSVLRMAIGRG